MEPVRRVAVVGAGPAGAITIDALAQEGAFDLIRVFERRSTAGGCWVADDEPPQTLPPDELEALASRTADSPLPIPRNLPAQAPKTARTRYDESAVYPYLETNVDYLPMEFTQEPFPSETSDWSRSIYGPSTPFRHWSVVQRYVQGLVDRKGYPDLVSYNTTVERAEKLGKEWKVTLRRRGESTDYWWVEWFDALVVANGHYNVPYIPRIDGLAQLQRARPGSVIHSKSYRGREAYKNKRVVVVGGSVSAADIAYDLTTTAKAPIYAVTIGHQFNGYFGDEAFNHPLISQKPSILKVDSSTRTVHFTDGTSVRDVDCVIFGTGFTWTLPFLPSVLTRNNRVPKLYQHVVYQDDPTLLFVGAVGAGLTFKVFEWQAVLAARILAGRVSLPPREEQQKWEEERIVKKGDGPKFTLIYPEFQEYFEALRALAGPAQGRGRELPAYNKVWFERFMAGHELRKDMWRRLNAKAKDALRQEGSDKLTEDSTVFRPKL